MNINGKITIFPAKRKIEVEGKEKEVVDITATISSKDGDKYINKKVKVHLVGKEFPEEKLLKLEDDKCYQFEVLDGFLGVEGWTTAKGELRREVILVITSGRLLSSKEVVRPIPQVQDSNLPF